MIRAGSVGKVVLGEGVIDSARNVFNTATSKAKDGIGWVTSKFKRDKGNPASKPRRAAEPTPIPKNGSMYDKLDARWRNFKGRHNLSTQFGLGGDLAIAGGGAGAGAVSGFLTAGPGGALAGAGFGALTSVIGHHTVHKAAVRGDKTARTLFSKRK